MFDNELMLRNTSDGSLEASEQAERWIDFGGPDVKALTYDVVVPAIVAEADTLDVIIQVSATDGGAVLDTFTLPQITGMATAIGVFRITFKTPHRWRRQYNTVAGVAPVFGIVLIGPQMGGEYDQF